jgi:heterodisulfide reductase subunit B2
MSLALYPGCSLNGSSKEYFESVDAVCKKLGISYSQVPDWNCCGATAAHNLNSDLSDALPSRIIAHAEETQSTELLVPCAACYNRLKSVQKKINESDEERKKIGSFLEKEIQASIPIKNIVDFVANTLIPVINENDIIPFHKKVACYYGCLLVRPNHIVDFDREEDPNSMEDIMLKLGAEPIDWAFKTECCGAGFTVSHSETVLRLSGKVLIDAVDRGAEVIIVACPMCQSNLDMRRKEIERYMGRKFDIPVLYITQALGLSLGIPYKDLGLQRHFVHVPESIINTNNN